MMTRKPTVGGGADSSGACGPPSAWQPACAQATTARRMEQGPSSHGALCRGQTVARSPGWTGDVGYFNQAMAAKYLPAPSPDTMIYVCGPPPLMESVSGKKNSPADQGELSGVLAKMGYSKEQVFKF